jgi:2-polyprenyl-3-methyl-5-hydroxy-6-metoxy-1,4-benzoquinol methylase
MTSEYHGLLEKIAQCNVKPPLFTPSEPAGTPFWDDPHISKSMLESHLDPVNPAASRPHKDIDAQVGHLLSPGLIKPGDKLLDMGCGPGLYASRIAARGIKVTGVDISERSLHYASAQARKDGLKIAYRRLNFLDLDYTAEFDAAMQVYGEMGVFSDVNRDIIFYKVREALKPGGLFIFDVTTPSVKIPPAPQNNWYFARSGFWRDVPHLTLEYRYDYPENDIFCNQYTVIDDEKMTVYRIWNHNYTPETIKPALEKAGFRLEHTWNDLSGTPYQAGGEWLAVMARKR